MPSFSILIVLYHSPLVYIETNLRNLNFENYEVIIVDNSEDKNYFTSVMNWVSNLPPQLSRKIKLFQSPKNTGYTGGNNLAFKFSKGDYLLIINPDMELGPNFLKKAIRIINAKNWAILAPKVYLDFGTKELQMTYIRFKKFSPFAILTLNGSRRIDNGKNDAYYETFCAPGGCFIISHELFRRLKGFDRNYFMYAEETDLCYRAQLLKEKIVYCPQLIVVHRGKNGDSIFAQRQMLQNNLLFFGKFFSFRLLVTQFLFSLGRISISLQITRENVELLERFRMFIQAIVKGFVTGWKYQINAQMGGP